MNTTPEKPNFGTFKPGTLIELLEMFSDSERSGTLLISSKLGIGTITILHGNVIFAFSFESSRKYAHELVESNQLSDRTVEPFIALIRKGPYTNDEFDVLMKSGISREDLKRAVDQTNLSTLTSINRWEGVYRFYDEEFEEPPVHAPVDKNRLRAALAESETTQADALDINLSDVISSELYDIVQKDQSPMEILSSSARQVSSRLSQLKPKDVVVLVESNDEFRNAIAENLTNFGLFVEDFSTPTDAFECIIAKQSEGIPVILVTDIEPPENSSGSEGGDGFELLRNVKDHCPHVPVIITGRVIQSDIRIKALFWGASGFIHKQGNEPAIETLSSHEITLFTEELCYTIWNIIKTREIVIEREHMSSLEQEMIDTIIEDFDDIVDRKDTPSFFQILVADDENEIRSAITQYLKMDGYENVDEATNGEEAIDFFTEKRHDLIILDLVMPKLGGKEAFFKLKKINPDLLVIFTSGYSENGQAYEILELDVEGFMQKPFPLMEFAKKIREALDKKKN